jgi:opacity protein-like surface antigen
VIFRKLVLCGIILILGLVPVFAADFYAGVKGGLALSDYWGATSVDSAGFTGTVAAGFCGGIVGVGQFTDNLGVQVETLFFQKGHAGANNSSTTNIEKDRQADYLEIPLLCRLCFPLKAERALVYAGPSFSYLLLSTSTTTTQSGGGDKTVTVVDTKASTSLTDIGIAVGGGMEFDIPTGEIIFDVRCTPGFITTDRGNKQTGQSGAGQGDIKNLAVSFMVGYAFKF